MYNSNMPVLNLQRSYKYIMYATKQPSLRINQADLKCKTGCGYYGTAESNGEDNLCITLVQNGFDNCILVKTCICTENFILYSFWLFRYNSYDMVCIHVYH